jgi:hypothetical protein
MPLPPKEMYSFCEVAEIFKVSVQEIEDYLLTGKLIASFYLRNTILGKFTPILNRDASYSDNDLYIWDIDYDYHGDPDLFVKRSGIFDLVYKDFAWDENWQTTVPKGFDLCLDWPHEYEGFYGLADPYLLKRDDLFITIKELERFGAEHGLMIEIPSVQNCQQIVTATVNSDLKFHPKEKESLLKMVIAMAINCYGFNPDDKRSDVPSKIMEEVENLGLLIDVDTVRKWLKEAAILYNPKKRSNQED